MITSRRQLIKHNHSYSLKSADSVSRRTIKTRGSGVGLKLPGGCMVRSRRRYRCPASGGVTEQNLEHNLAVHEGDVILRLTSSRSHSSHNGTFIVSTLNGAFASSCEASADVLTMSPARRGRKCISFSGTIPHSQLKHWLS